MSAKEQYEEFHRWLVAKFDEVDTAYEETLATDAEPETRSRYAALLKRIADEMIWTNRQIKELQRA